MEPYYIGNDCETGGIGPDVSLLTACFKVLDWDFNTIDTLNLYMKPEDGIYKCTAEALAINKIDLIAHDKIAITYKEAGTKLYEFLNKHSNKGKIKLVPLGHNVYFDIEKYVQNIISKKSWLYNVSYRLADTGVILEFLKRKGKVPKTVSGSMGSMCAFLGIPYEKGHTAEGDVDLATECYKRLLAL